MSSDKIEAYRPYYDHLMADVRREADTSGVMMVEAFFDTAMARICEAGEIDDAERAFFEGKLGHSSARIDGFTPSPRDNGGVLGLVICDFGNHEAPEMIMTSERTSLANKLIAFLNKARDPDFRDSLNEISPAFQVSDTIIAHWKHITKIKLIIVSNRIYGGKTDNKVLANVADRPVTLSIWDIARFESYDSSGLAREDMIIDLERDFGASLPALKASAAGDGCESYLLIVPGLQLATIYERWGARLLEANVRTFLQARAKTNKGIQKTILEEPDLFFPYNNGLSATADAVECVKTSDGLAIRSISNLQIVNGAQTTGSIHASLKKAKDALSRIYVQMKLTVVPKDMAEEIVPRISEFANTQNKVNAADFFSNHPFHIKIEQMSRSILLNAPDGELHDRKWFYERSRGQYLNARNKLTPANQRKFDLEFPKKLLFSKTDLAKIEHSALGLPHIVSRGAQKNFSEFAKSIGDNWQQKESNYNELWYRRFVAKALIFKRLEQDIPKSQWYEGGYRANIVTYAIAKVFHDAAAAGFVIDLDLIWKQQWIGTPLAKALLAAAQAAQSHILAPQGGIRNIGEWAKTQACWSTFRDVQIVYDDDVELAYICKDTAKSALASARKDEIEQNNVAALTTVMEKGPAFWSEVLSYARKIKAISPLEAVALGACAGIPSKIPTDYQAKRALAVFERVIDAGFQPL